MDFNSFDSRKRGATGAWLHLKHPSSGALLYADNDHDRPCRVRVMGNEAPAAQEAFARIQKAKAKEAAAVKDKAAPTRSPAEVHQDLVDLALPLILGFENIDNGSAPATAEDAVWFLNLQITNGQADEQSFAEQVVAFGFKRASILGNGPTG